jgi:uncharacterized protein
MNSRLFDRLRGIADSMQTRPGSQEHAGAASSPELHNVPSGRRVQASLDDEQARHRNLDVVADTLGAEWYESHGQRCLVINRAYEPGHRHGCVPIMDSIPDRDRCWEWLSLLHTGTGNLGSVASVRGLLFVDLETTGLTGGAGTYAFLVGCGWFDGSRFRVRQFFLSSFASEAALLDAVASMARDATAIITYNGKSFDLPLIETRFLFHRMDPPFAGMPHVDMLHPARRLWRAEDPHDTSAHSSCRLAVLERALCGVVREEDVHGFEIPARYFTYVRTGDARPLKAVVKHNRLDLMSLAILTARAAQLLYEGPEATRTTREALGLGHLYERGCLWDRACACYARGAGLEGDLPADAMSCAESLRSYALLCRRLGRYTDAANAWQRVLSLARCPSHIAREASEALAIHHEHRLRDLQMARVFALESLQFTLSVKRQHAGRHRLARLERKLASAARHSLPLFGATEGTGQNDVTRQRSLNCVTR